MFMLWSNMAECVYCAQRGEGTGEMRINLTWCALGGGGGNSCPGRYVLKNLIFIELGLKMIQFKIQFKTKSKNWVKCGPI